MFLKKCLKWYVMRSNASKAERDEITSGNGRCHECNKTYRNVRHRNKKQLPKFNRKARELRTAASSNYPYDLMSPRQQKRKRQNLQKERKKQKRIINELSQKLRERTEVALEKDQSGKLSDFVHIVTEEKMDDALQNGNKDTAAALKEIGATNGAWLLIELVRIYC